LVKIADRLDDARNERERLGTAPALRVQSLAEGQDWGVEDVVCTFRPGDSPFEERHGRYRVALVGAGAFQCRSPLGGELLTPGSLLLGNLGERFECGHAHGTGDRCLAFGYAPEMFERLAFEAGVRGKPRLRALRVPPLDALARLAADASALWLGPQPVARDVWEEIAVRSAAAAVRFAADTVRVPRSPANAERGVARVVRLIERDPCAHLPLHELAREGQISRFHFVRAFARVTGLTPHRYLKRARLRAAAVRLALGDARIIDVVLTCGFRDVSNFNHAFKEEFGVTPRQHRARLRGSRERSPAR
jgi:AraC-like DNA-binding protein